MHRSQGLIQTKLFPVAAGEPPIKVDPLPVNTEDFQQLTLGSQVPPLTHRPPPSRGFAYHLYETPAALVGCDVIAKWRLDPDAKWRHRDSATSKRYCRICSVQPVSMLRRASVISQHSGVVAHCEPQVFMART